MKHFIIIGERRCGTTTLYHWIKQHPAIEMYPKTDWNFFVENFLNNRKNTGTGEPWKMRKEEYLAQRSGGVWGHKGADLFYWEPAHQRIKSFCPSAKFILLLRDPVKRMWSQYWNEVAKGRESLTFEEALAQDFDRLKDPYTNFHLAYLNRSRYKKSMTTFLKSFHPEQLHIVTSEDLFSDPKGEMKKIFGFLQVNEDFCQNIQQKKYNENAALLARPITNAPIIKNFAGLYTRVAESFIVRVTKSSELRRRLRGKIYSPFYSSGSKESLSQKLGKELFSSIQEDIQYVEEVMGKRLHQWRVNWE